MDFEDIKSEYEVFLTELYEDVAKAYKDYDTRYYGEQLFESLVQKIKTFAEMKGIRNVPPVPYIPPSSIGIYRPNRSQNEIRMSNYKHFWGTRGAKLEGYLKSILKEVDKGTLVTNLIMSKHENSTGELSNQIFVVHGHDDGLKNGVLRFLSQLGLEGFVLHEQPSQSKTIIEKIEHYSKDIGFALVLYTKDDLGSAKASEQQKPRARQNVVFEHGYLVGKLGRTRVIPLVEDGIEIPNDISGIVYVSTTTWQFDVAKELKAAGYQIDINKLI